MTLPENRAGRDMWDVVKDRVVSGVVGALLAAGLGAKMTGDHLSAIDNRLTRIETVMCTQLNCPH